MNRYERNIKVFKENRQLAKTKYIEETENLIANTKVYKKPLTCKVPEHIGKCEILFDRKDTITSTLYYTRNGYKVCALNFADALTPGGLVCQGEVTQEEDLCRCSNLYESLLKQECRQDYYEYNRGLGTRNYSDRVIYSEGVTLLRESLNYTLLDEPLKCDIVTSPAPIYVGDKKGYYRIIENRIRGFLKVVASKRVNVVILGAWGCGAFGGDARIVGKAFAKVLQEFRNFDKVIFSVKSTVNDRIDNLALLATGFNA